jgi:hypothetical protein
MDIRKPQNCSASIAPLAQRAEFIGASDKNRQEDLQAASKRKDAEDQSLAARRQAAETARKLLEAQRAAAADEQAKRFPGQLSAHAQRALQSYQAWEDHAQLEARSELRSLMGIDYYI